MLVTLRRADTAARPLVAFWLLSRHDGKFSPCASGVTLVTLSGTEGVLWLIFGWIWMP
jgi:hypothetical protein